mgnify:FL=1|tara:strand:+ start:97 stop:366 length:270 start_codon:yes stop_codon:yes gene_type:complete
MIPGNQVNQESQVKVSLSDAETIKCKDCNNYLWIQSFILKKISALVSPSGKDALVPVQVYSCGACGKVAEGMLEGSGVDEKSNFPSLDI